MSSPPSFSSLGKRSRAAIEPVVEEASVAASTIRPRRSHAAYVQRESVSVTAMSPTTTEPRTPTSQQIISMLGDENNENRFFEPSHFVIMGEAYQMIITLATTPGPYKTKLKELSTIGINFVIQKLGSNPDNLTPEKVISRTLTEMTCYLALPSDPRLGDNATAFACVGDYSGEETSGGKRFPLFGIRQCYRLNDFLAAEQDEASRANILGSPEGRRTLLLFLRKMKHEILHLVHSYPAMAYLPDMDSTSIIKDVTTPQQYTPMYQATAGPEVGDHDEEEDSAGPILPRRNLKLSATNPLCLLFNNKYYPLDDHKIRGLLDIRMYLAPVGSDSDINHADGNWSFRDCRAYQRGVLSTEFIRATARRNNTLGGTEALARRSSPATPRTPNHNKVAPWRLPANGVIYYYGNDPRILDRLGVTRRNIVSRSSSPLSSSRSG